MSKYFDRLNQFYIIKVVEIIIYVLLIILMIYLGSLMKTLTCGVKFIYSILNRIIFKYDL